MPASRIAPGMITETPIPVRAQVLAQARARSRGGRTWSRVHRGARCGDLAGERGDEDDVTGAALAPSPAAAPASSGSGDSRLTRSARSICSWVKPSSLPEAGQAGVGDEHVDVARLREQAAAPRPPRRGRRRSCGGRHRAATRRAPRAPPALARAEDQRRAAFAASASAIARPRPPVAPVSSARLAAQLHRPEPTDAPAHSRMSPGHPSAGAGGAAPGRWSSSPRCSRSSRRPPSRDAAGRGRAAARAERLRLDRRGRDGTGSPHLTDQIELFNELRLQAVRVRPAGRRPSRREPGVDDRPRLLRRPRDHRRQRRTTPGGASATRSRRTGCSSSSCSGARPAGRLAEILGSTYLDDDLIARRDYYTDAEIDAMVAGSRRSSCARTEAYRDGINAWIEHVSSPDPAGHARRVRRAQTCRSTTGRCATRRGSASSSPAPSRRRRRRARERAGARSDRRRRTSTRCSRSARRGRGSTIPRVRGQASRPSPGAPAATSARGFRRSQDFLAEHRPLRRSTTPRPRSPVADADRRRAGAPAPTSPHPAQPGRLVHVGDRATASASAPTSSTGRSSASRSPSCSSSSSCTRPSQPNLRGVSAAGDPAGRDRPQRPRRLGLHLRASPTRTTSTSRSSPAPRPTSFQGERAADGLPRRGLHLQHARRPTCPT